LQNVFWRLLNARVEESSTDRALIDELAERLGFSDRVVHTNRAYR
jgi:hypothetical protein